MKIDTETKFQGLQLLPNDLSMFFIAKLRQIEFCSGRQKNYFTCNSLKRDGVALVGLPPAALGPQDIPHRRTARPELAGALFRYINSLENLQSFLNSTSVYRYQSLLTIKQYNIHRLLTEVLAKKLFMN